MLIVRSTTNCDAEKHQGLAQLDPKLKVLSFPAEVGITVWDACTSTAKDSSIKRSA